MSEQSRSSSIPAYKVMLVGGIIIVVIVAVLSWVIYSLFGPMWSSTALESKDPKADINYGRPMQVPLDEGEVRGVPPRENDAAPLPKEGGPSINDYGPTAVPTPSSEDLAAAQQKAEDMLAKRAESDKLQEQYFQVWLKSQDDKEGLSSPVEYFCANDSTAAREWVAWQLSGKTYAVSVGKSGTVSSNSGEIRSLMGGLKDHCSGGNLKPSPPTMRPVWPNDDLVPSDVP